MFPGAPDFHLDGLSLGVPVGQRFADEQVDAVAAVLAFDVAAALDDPLQPDNQDQVRCGLMIGVLAGEDAPCWRQKPANSSTSSSYVASASTS